MAVLMLRALLSFAHAIGRPLGAGGVLAARALPPLGGTGRAATRSAAFSGATDGADSSIPSHALPAAR